MRFVILDHRGRFWSADGWTADLHRAIVYASPAEASGQLQELEETTPGVRAQLYRLDEAA
jgi:hypothetical protein